MLRRFTLLVLLVSFSCTVLAQYDSPSRKRSSAGSRDGRFEASVILAYQTSSEESFEGGSELAIDSTAGWGISFGWNWTDKLNLQYRLLSTSPKYQALVVPEDPLLVPIYVNYKMQKYSHQLNATYNFSRKPFTPFVVGGIGFTKLDSNILDGPPQTGCWWHPWWGYICFTDWSTYGSTEFTYNLGVGFRWDINNAVYTKAAFSREFISLDNGSLNFDIATVEMGLMF